MEPQLSPGKKPVRPRFQAGSGKDFPVDTVPTIEANTKGFLLRAFTVFAMSALAITGLYTLAYQKYGPLIATWSVIGPILGAMVNHYFGAIERIKDELASLRA